MKRQQTGSGDRALGRRFVAVARSAIADERARQAAERDYTASQRDRAAEERDSAANRRDLESVKLERKIARRGSSLQAAVALARDARVKAAQDRARAAEDRAQAAMDRAQAARERAEMTDELRHAHLDELTGALRRGAGEMALQKEIDRVRRADGSLVLAFVDVDSLRDVNNHSGHSAGDALLRDVVSAIRARVRSYEPIVRLGGDEFVCAISSVDRDQAAERFAQIGDAIARQSGGATVSVGLAELRPEDDLRGLIDRADGELMALRAQRRGGD